MNRITKDSDEADFRSAQPSVANVKAQFGRRLQRLLLAKGMNQSDFARAAGLERNSISSYVRGKSIPNALSLKKISDALRVKPTDLIPETGLTEGPVPYQITSVDNEHDRIVCDIVVPKSAGAQIYSLIVANATSYRE